MADSDHVGHQLDQKLSCLSLKYPNTFIFKVPHQLRCINEKAYEPHMVSVGPYHRGKPHLKAMEMHKLHCLKMLLQRQKENVARYVDAMRTIENEARDCYDQVVFDDVSPEAFLEMMVIDGCFIVELIVRSMAEQFREPENYYIDDVLKAKSITLMHDLLLLENQLPFRVLLDIYGMSYKSVLPNDHEANFISMALVFFLPILPGPGLIQKEQCSQDVKHLLGLIHDQWLPSPQGINNYRFLFQDKYYEWRFIRSASELREAGIMFEMIPVGKKYKAVQRKGDSLFDISFEKGKMKIPTLSVYADTERFFRNLMAYEQQFVINRPTYVTDYIIFMDSVINSGKDVKILCRCGIINHWLGDDEVVANMFNGLRDFIFTSHHEFYYKKIFNDVNMYCNQRRNVWNAKLRHDYCNTPWALISFLAASALLLLALAQTLFSGLAYTGER